MTREQIIEVVKRHLEGLPFAIEIVEEGVQQQGDWWNLPVRAKDPPKRQWRYYEILANIEEDVTEETRQEVLLLPVA